MGGRTRGQRKRSWKDKQRRKRVSNQTKAKKFRERFRRRSELEDCPKCSKKMGEHRDRWHCGSCGYSLPKAFFPLIGFFRVFGVMINET